jgi:hypothetical protein
MNDLENKSPPPEISCCSLQTDLSPPEFRRWRRIHGLQKPLHPQQILGWILLISLGVATFVLLLPALNWTARIFLQPIMGILFAIHVISHIISLVLDPAELELRKIPRRRYPVPEFDRTKHAHVIEEGRCHLCNIAVTGIRTKHCSACNKCVANFDHHCKWLNHCVGGRNYYPFLICVASAGFAALAIAAISMIEITFFYSFPQYLEFDLYNTTDTVPLPLLLQDTIVFPSVTSIIALLAITTSILLLHLFAFHIYIAVNGITTYEYIRNYRYYSENKPARIQSRNISRNGGKLQKVIVDKNRTHKFNCCEQNHEKLSNEMEITNDTKCYQCKSDHVSPELVEKAKQKHKKPPLLLKFCFTPDESEPKSPKCFARKSGRVKPAVENVPQNSSPVQTQLSDNLRGYDVYTIDPAPL